MTLIIAIFSNMIRLA